MTCHLIQKEKFKSREEITIKKVKVITGDDNHFNLYEARCTQCEQIYIGCFWEIVDWVHGDDEIWVFYVPATRDEIDALVKEVKEFKKNAIPITPEADVVPIFFGAKVIEATKHLVWDPYGNIYWREGSEAAFMQGPG